LAKSNIKPFQLDDYSINMGGMKLDIYPVKKTVLNQLNISEAGALVNTFTNTGHFMKITNGTAQSRLELQTPRLYHYYKRE
jgi:hypothetical protein